MPFSRILSEALLGLTVHGVLAAETAILTHLELVRGVFLVLDGVVVPLLAFVAPERDLDSQFRHLLLNLAAWASCLPVWTRELILARRNRVFCAAKTTSLPTGKARIAQP